MSTITDVRDLINDQYMQTGKMPDNMEIYPDVLASLKSELQASAKYLEQGYVVSDGPVDWTNFRFMGVLMLSKPVITQPETVI